MTHLQLEKAETGCEKAAFCHWKDWINITASACSSRIFVAVFSVQQCYSECAFYCCCADILSANLSWDAYISCVQYSSLSCFISVFHFSEANMSTMLFMMSVAFFTDLALTDLVFRTDSDKFVNSLTFKTVLMNSVWWWEWWELKDLLLCFFILV